MTPPGHSTCELSYMSARFVVFKRANQRRFRFNLHTRFLPSLHMHALASLPLLPPFLCTQSEPLCYITRDDSKQDEAS